jgi:hypothetical protein
VKSAIILGQVFACSSAGCPSVESEARRPLEVLTHRAWGGRRPLKATEREDRCRSIAAESRKSTPIPVGYTVKRQPLPDDLKHFDEAAAVADRLASTPSLDEIRQRIKRAQVNCAPL